MLRRLLDTFRSLAACIDDELGSERRSWVNIHPLRAKQRDIIGRLLQADGCSNHYFTYLRGVLLPWSVDTASQYTTGRVQKVYVRINPDVPSLRYVGRHHGACAERDRQHLDGAARSPWKSRKESLYSQRLSLRNGGPGMFIDMPVFICASTATVTDVHRIEQRFARRHGTMQGWNERAQFLHPGVDKPAKPARRRPVQRLRHGRSRQRDADATNAASRPTMFSSPARQTSDFAAMLRHVAATTTDEVRVRVTAGTCDYTNYVQARGKFGNSRIGITFADGVHVVTTVAAWCRTVRASPSIDMIAYEPVRSIDILSIEQCRLRLWPFETAKQLGSHPHASRRVARDVTYGELVDIWRAAKSIHDVRLRRRAEEQILGISKKKFGVSLKAAAVISAPASAMFPSHLVKQAGKSLLRRVAENYSEYAGPIQRLVSSLRVTRQRAPTVGGTLINNIAACCEFDPDQQPQCVCHRFPKRWRRQRQFGGHFGILSAEYTGPGQSAMRVSHKSPFEVGYMDLYAELTKSLRDMVYKLPAALQSTITSEDVQQVVKQTCNRTRELRHDQQSSERYESAPIVMKRDVVAAKRYLHGRGAVVATVDKGAGRLFVMCPVVNWMIMKQSWPDEPHRCEVMCPAGATEELSDLVEQNINYNYIKAYNDNNWQSIAPISGVDYNGKPRGGLLPAGYANPKLKSILAATAGRKAVNSIKGRPISPHTKHPLRHVYNRTATAHHYLLTQINSQRVTRLWDTASYTTRLRDESIALQAVHSSGGGGALKYLWQFGDLDGMYTALSFARMSEALRNNIVRLKASSAADRRYPLRGLDRISVGRTKQDGIRACALGPAYNKDEQIEIKFSDLQFICDYSNDASIMRVGKQIRRYLMGTPMGEQGSCAKANGVCMDDELTLDATHDDSQRNLSLAFVDDKHARVAYDDVKWSKASAEVYIKELMKYSDPLVMVTEPVTAVTAFLETSTIYPGTDGVGAYARHKYRPWSKHSYRIVSGGISGMVDLQVATAAGTFMRIVDNCTFEADAALAIATEMHEMEEGAGMSRRQTMTALQKLGGNKPMEPTRTLKRQGFLTRFLHIIETLRYW